MYNSITLLIQAPVVPRHLWTWRLDITSKVIKTVVPLLIKNKNGTQRRHSRSLSYHFQSHDMMWRIILFADKQTRCLLLLFVLDERTLELDFGWFFFSGVNVFYNTFRATLQFVSFLIASKIRQFSLLHENFCPYYILRFISKL